MKPPAKRQVPDRPQRLPRLSGAEHRILELLASDGELYGLQLVERSQGRLKRGTVYVTLQRMEDKELVESRLESRQTPLPGLPRRLYRPTRSGLALLRAIELAAAAFFDPEFQA